MNETSGVGIIIIAIVILMVIGVIKEGGEEWVEVKGGGWFRRLVLLGNIDNWAGGERFGWKVLFEWFPVLGNKPQGGLQWCKGITLFLLWWLWRGLLCWELWFLVGL